jgi:CO/xanthine dehydrogenase Mo-binding subunit
MDMDLDEMVRLAAEGLGWDGASPAEPGASGRRRGRGVAISLRHGAQGGGRTYAMATIDGAGTVHISHAAPELGEGSTDMVGTVAARTMGLPPDRIVVEPPDTQHGLNFEGAAAQRTTVHMGNAVKAACESLKRELRNAAAEAKGGTEDDWEVRDGAVVGRGQSYELWEIVSSFATAPSFEGHVVLKGLGSYSYAPSEDKAFGGLDHWSPGVAAVEIEVDEESGAIRLQAMSLVTEAGHVIHYGSTRGQTEGGAMMGLALALNEEVVYEDGHMSNANGFHYRIAAMRDVPEDVSVSVIANCDGPGPFGAKGLAQTSIPCMTPAIANAFLDATGCVLESAPFTPEKVLHALGRLGAAHA